MKIAIAGYGVEGASNYRYFKAAGHDVTIVDENSTLKHNENELKTKEILGKGSFEKLQNFDMVVRTAGLDPKKIKTDGKIWSATNEFFAKCQAPIIGVTGTKGKGTTASLIASILRSDGYKVHLVGNIGVPALDVLADISEDDIVVYELSSFQLWDLEKSPHIATVLMIEQDHLDVHTDFTDYLSAKSNICRYQTADDICVYHPSNKYSREIADLSGGKVGRYGIADDGLVYVKDDAFYCKNDMLAEVKDLQLPGAHNRENACAAISACLSFLIDSRSVVTGLRSFDGLPHRLKFVRSVNGVSYYDDSIATTPGSAIAAIKAFQQPKIIILGGSDKGSSYEEIIDECAKTNTKVITIGNVGPGIASICREKNVEVHEVSGDMHAVVRKAQMLASEDAVVLLSPASASFDQYKNYNDRGDKFVEAVKEIKE